MLKKMRRLLAFTLAFVMMFSMTAFAAEKETTIHGSLRMQSSLSTPLFSFYSIVITEALITFAAQNCRSAFVIR